MKEKSNNAEEQQPKDLNLSNDKQIDKNDKINDTPLEKIQVDRKLIDPIVKLIKDQEPLSYRVGEKMMEEKKHNLSMSMEKDSDKHIEDSNKPVESEKLLKLKPDPQLEDLKPLYSEQHVVDVQKKSKSSHENQDEIHEDLKNEMRKKRDTDGLDELLKSNPIDLQLKSIISRDLKAVKDEAK